MKTNYEIAQELLQVETRYPKLLADAAKRLMAAQPPQQSAQPVAAANGWAKGLEIRMSQGWKLKGGICPVLYSDTVNGYGVGRDDLWLATTDALKSAQPVEVQRVPLTDEFLRANGVMVHGDGNVFFTNVQQLNRVLGIKPTSSEGGA